MTVKRYGVILADPPWAYRNAGGNGAAANHYPTMNIDELCALPVGYLAANTSILYLWATWPQLPESMRLIAAWGYTYKTGLPWVKGNLSDDDTFKPSMGTGFWVRGCSELLLIAVRGKPAVPPPAERKLGLLAPRARHSQKPNDIYELAERHPGPWLELFAREHRVGWDVYGDEVAQSICLQRELAL